MSTNPRRHELYVTRDVKIALDAIGAKTGTTPDAVAEIILRAGIAGEYPKLLAAAGETEEAITRAYKEQRKKLDAAIAS